MFVILSEARRSIATECESKDPHSLKPLPAASGSSPRAPDGQDRRTEHPPHDQRLSPATRPILLLRQPNQLVHARKPSPQNRRPSNRPWQPREPRPDARIPPLRHWRAPAPATSHRGNSSPLFVDRLLATRLLDCSPSRPAL